MAFLRRAVLLPPCTSKNNIRLSPPVSEVLVSISLHVAIAQVKLEIRLLLVLWIDEKISSVFLHHGLPQNFNLILIIQRIKL